MPCVTCCPCDNRLSESTDNLRSSRKNNDINKYLKKERKRIQNRQMILLLGTGESGKSTFLRQMKIINGKRFEQEEMKQFRDSIYDNIYKGVLFLLNIRETLNLEWTEPSEKAIESAKHLENHYMETVKERLARRKQGELMWSEEEFLCLVDHFRELWDNQAIKDSFEHRSKMLTESFSENTRYYLNKLKYIGIKNYKPTNEDIVWSRKPTEAIIEEEIALYGINLVFVDVGGQTKERHKWCQFFSDMNSVLFLVASSHFDEYYQDRVTKAFRNKLFEALVVFHGLINHTAFRNVSIILFFNKTDVLKEKVAKEIDIFKIQEFRRFSSKYNYKKLESVQTFLVDMFASCIDQNAIVFNQFFQTGDSNNVRKSNSSAQDEKASTNSTLIRDHSEGRASRALNRQIKSRSTSDGVRTIYSVHPDPGADLRYFNVNNHSKRTIYKHFTTAVDRQNIETVFNAMQDTVLQNNLRRIMMH